VWYEGDRRKRRGRQCGREDEDDGNEDEWDEGKRMKRDEWGWRRKNEKRRMKNEGGTVNELRKVMSSKEREWKKEEWRREDEEGPMRMRQRGWRRENEGGRIRWRRMKYGRMVKDRWGPRKRENERGKMEKGWRARRRERGWRSEDDGGMGEMKSRSFSRLGLPIFGIMSVWDEAAHFHALVCQFLG
jgi:hypothetical protein